MILPATIGDGTPRAIPMLINARPTVPTVPHAPMSTPISSRIITASNDWAIPESIPLKDLLPGMSKPKCDKRCNRTAEDQRDLRFRTANHHTDKNQHRRAHKADESMVKFCFMFVQQRPPPRSLFLRGEHSNTAPACSLSPCYRHTRLTVVRRG